MTHKQPHDSDTALDARRQFLRFLAASPLLGMGWGRDSLATTIVPPADLAGLPATDLTLAYVPASPQDAYNVFDLEAAAWKTLPPAHFGYIAEGAGGRDTVRANREGFHHFALRPRRMIDVSRIDMSTTLFGRRWSSPIMFSPTSSQRALNPDAELATARAAKATDTNWILATLSTTPIEDVIAARGEPTWFQLYPTNVDQVRAAVLKRVHDAGCPVIVVTVDDLELRSAEGGMPYQQMDTRDCKQCHNRAEGFQDFVRRKPILSPYVDQLGGSNFFKADISWDFIRRLRDQVRAPLILKGILTAEDAELAVKAGVDGILVSNHGGRVESGGLATIMALGEVVAAVKKKIPVLVDGGFRRGGDIFKALALGADAVCVGRPYLWGLGSFGQAGVERVVEILRAELEHTMAQVGTTSLAQINRNNLKLL
jgi:4-hydroxymandelate oxidase